MQKYTTGRLKTEIALAVAKHAQFFDGVMPGSSAILADSRKWAREWKRQLDEGEEADCAFGSDLEIVQDWAKYPDLKRPIHRAFTPRTGDDDVDDTFQVHIYTNNSDNAIVSFTVSAD